MSQQLEGLKCQLMNQFMEARYDEVLSESTKLAALGQEMSSDFSADGLPTIAPFREALGGVQGTPVIVAGGYDTENIWDVVDSGVSTQLASSPFPAEGYPD